MSFGVCVKHIQLLFIIVGYEEYSEYTIFVSRP
jgi:hypothetical protein